MRSRALPPWATRADSQPSRSFVPSRLLPSCSRDGGMASPSGVSFIFSSPPVMNSRYQRLDNHRPYNKGVACSELACAGNLHALPAQKALRNSLTLLAFLNL